MGFGVRKLSRPGNYPASFTWETGTCAAGRKLSRWVFTWKVGFGVRKLSRPGNYPAGARAAGAGAGAGAGADGDGDGDGAGAGA